MEFMGYVSLIFSHGSSDNCFKPKEILDFSLSNLVIFKSNSSPTVNTSEGWFILFQVMSVICKSPSIPPKSTKAP